MKKKSIFYSLVLTAAAVAGAWWVWKNFFTEIVETLFFTLFKQDFSFLEKL